MRRATVVLAVLAMLAVGCGKSSKSSSETSTGSGSSTTAGGAKQYAVQLDGKTNAFVGEFGSFYPDKLTVHPGDSVQFNLPNFSGVPHTVTFGTLVDKAVAKIDQLGPQATPDAQENSPEMLNLPDVFTHKNPTNGPPDANQSAAQPCYLTTGVPPLSLTGSAPACPKATQPDFDGTQAFYNSGVLGKDGATFSLKVAANTKPGVYSYICLIHRGIMTGKLTVAGADASIPSPADVTAAGTKQFNDAVAAVTPAAQAAQKSPASAATLGTGDPAKAPSVVVAEFGPKSLSIPVGGSVTWNEFAFHTLTFGATDADVGVLTTAADGSVHFAKGGAPAGFTVPPSLSEFPPPANSKPTVVDLGSYDGTGFKSTGITGSVPPQFISFKLTFTKAGTYVVRCLVHPDMKGEIKVG